MFRDIIKGCRKRWRKDQKELYEMFYAYGMSITLRYADSREEAVDILNDAFMKVFTNIRTYNEHQPFKPWLRKIIVNTAINHYHKNSRMEKWEYLEESNNKLSTESMALSGIHYDEIIEMVQQLSPSYRTVFNLYVIEGFKHEEISEILGISIGTSKSNLSKAKRNLRSLLEENLI